MDQGVMTTHRKLCFYGSYDVMNVKAGFGGKNEWIYLKDLGQKYIHRWQKKQNNNNNPLALKDGRCCWTGHIYSKGWRTPRNTAIKEPPVWQDFQDNIQLATVCHFLPGFSSCLGPIMLLSWLQTIVSPTVSLVYLKWNQGRVVLMYPTHMWCAPRKRNFRCEHDRRRSIRTAPKLPKPTDNMKSYLISGSPRVASASAPWLALRPAAPPCPDPSPDPAPRRSAEPRRPSGRPGRHTPSGTPWCRLESDWIKASFLLFLRDFPRFELELKNRHTSYNTHM